MSKPLIRISVKAKSVQVQIGNEIYHNKRAAMDVIAEYENQEDKPHFK